MPLSLSPFRIVFVSVTFLEKNAMTGAATELGAARQKKWYFWVVQTTK